MDQKQTITELLIPHGEYCYDDFGKCPFWNKRHDKPLQENGYCSYLKCGDWENNGLGLLWDQCKECSINIE